MNVALHTVTELALFPVEVDQRVRELDAGSKAALTSCLGQHRQPICLVEPVKIREPGLDAAIALHLRMPVCTRVFCLPGFANRIVREGGTGQWPDFVMHDPEEVDG